MGWITTLSGYLTPMFLVLSPVLSYSDQAYSMHRTRTSAGFSLDIPLIMLVASLLRYGLSDHCRSRLNRHERAFLQRSLTQACPFRIFYYPGAKYDNALLAQSFVMVAMQVVLLKIALDHRPAPYSRGGDAAVPFARVNESRRPFDFWQWRSPKPWVALRGCTLLHSS